MLHVYRQHLSKATELSLSRFFIGTGLAAINSIIALYMREFGLSESGVGYLSAALIATSILASLFATPLLEYFNQRRMLLTTLVLSSIAYAVMANITSIYIFAAIAITATVLSLLRRSCFDIILRDNTKGKQLNKEEGILYSMLNAGWLIGPLLAGFFLIQFGIRSVFYIAVIFLIIAFLILLLLNIQPAIKKRTKIDTNILKNVKSYFTTKNVVLPYILTLGIHAWWSLLFIFIPLFLVNAGLEKVYVTTFISALIVPLVILDYRVGKMSMKYGIKPFFIIGFAGLAVCALSLAFISDIYIKMGVLIFSSIFLACLEPMQDTFFFSRVRKKDEEKFYPVFSTSIGIGSLIGRLALSTVLIFFTEAAAYITIAVLMTISFVIALKITETKKHIKKLKEVQ